MVEPAARVEPEMRYWDRALGVMVRAPMVRRAAGAAAPAVEGAGRRREVLGP